MILVCVVSSGLLEFPKQDSQAFERLWRLEQVTLTLSVLKKGGVLYSYSNEELRVKTLLKLNITNKTTTEKQ